MKKSTLLILMMGILLLIAPSCSRKGAVKQTLQKADTLLANNLPDSALAVIGTIPMEQLQHDADKADFILLYERVLENNNLPLIGEEDLTNAIDYFEKKSSTGNLFLAKYYLGRIYHLSGDSYQAMTQYVEAEGLYTRMAAEGTKVRSSLYKIYNKTLSHLYTYKGDLYQNKLNLNAALKMYLKALELDKTPASIMELLGKAARIYEAQEKYDQALDTYSAALEIARNNNNSKATLLYGSSLAGVSFAMGTPSGKVLEQLDALYRQYNNGAVPTDNYILLACLYLDNGNIKMAKEYATSYMENSGNLTNLEEAGWATLLSSICKAEGNYKAALEYKERYSAIMEQISEQEKNSSIQEIEQLYYNRQLKVENESIRRQNRSTLIIYTLMVIILLGAMAWGYITWRRKIQEKNKQIEEYLAASQQAENNRAILLDQLDSQKEKERRLKELLENRFAEIRELAGTYYEFGYSKKLQKKVEQLLSFQSFGQDMFEVIENVVNAKNNGVIERVRTEYPSITDDNIKLLNLIYAGFSPQEISVIINDTPQNIYVRKSRLKRKLAPLMEQEPEMAFK